MTAESFLDGRVTLHPGDCMDVLARLEECSIDSVVTDPPYHLTSVPLNSFGVQDRRGGRSPTEKTARSGFMGKSWDGGDIAFRPELWREVLRVLKPGAHLVAFGGTRTYHRMACAIEDAGFEVRDQIQWLYGSGFPKSLDVSKAIDKAAGAERPILGQYIAPDGNPRGIDRGIQGGNFANGNADYVAEKLVTGAATDEARQWSGFGTALKPACEPIVLARKPLSESTVAANVLKWGTGGLNIGACRVEHVAVNGGNLADNPQLRTEHKSHAHFMAAEGGNRENYKPAALGRWPANVILEDCDEVVGAFPESAGQNGSVSGGEPSSLIDNVYSARDRVAFGARGDNSGSAARFFYTAKADSDDRLGSKHPTVKPLDLIEYLEVLVTPPGGTILDPFAGTGTAGEAAFRRGFKAILIERETEYQNDIRRRMALCLSGPAERKRESVKARGDKPFESGTLFA